MGATQLQIPVTQPQSEGTPKTAIQAIQNGICEWAKTPEKDPAPIIWKHVRDFLAQHFTWAIFQCPKSLESTFKSFWNKIINEVPQPSDLSQKQTEEV